MDPKPRPLAIRSLLGWRSRLAIDLALFLGTLLALDLADAPRWTYFLVVFISTRTGRLDSAADTAALQSTYRVRLESIQLDLAALAGKLDKMRPGQ